nr:unnamed protein product [Digitaria exilis]
MDQHGEKEEAENKSQDSAEKQREDGDDAAEEEEKVMDTYKAAEESAAPLIKEVTAAGSEESSSPAAHPCSLLQLLLRTCAGCLGLHGDDDPKPAAAAAEDSSQEGENGDKANGEVITRVFAVRRPTPPGDRPREGDGGNGGVHH